MQRMWGTTATLAPTSGDRTSLPRATTTPAGSTPSTCGSTVPRFCPSARTRRSRERFTVTACTATTTSSGPGSGSGTSASSRTSGPPNRRIRIALTSPPQRPVRPHGHRDQPPWGGRLFRSCRDRPSRRRPLRVEGAGWHVLVIVLRQHIAGAGVDAHVHGGALGRPVPPRDLCVDALPPDLEHALHVATQVQRRHHLGGPDVRHAGGLLTDQLHVLQPDQDAAAVTGRRVCEEGDGAEVGLTLVVGAVSTDAGRLDDVGHADELRHRAGGGRE